jgi:competence protein ComEA
MDGDEAIRSQMLSGNYRPIFKRVILLALAFAVSVPVLYKSRPVREHPIPAALPFSATNGYVRISGDVRHAGIYSLSVNMVTGSAIKMAEPLFVIDNQIPESDLATPVENGTALNVTVQPNGTALLVRNTMTVTERMIMGVPLDINTMTEADFDKIPGIGPVMAKRILMYRHNNGGTMTVGGLLSIEGIGEKKYNVLMKYFK